MSSNKMDWRTPENVLSRLRGVEMVGLDPCASYEGRVGARVEWHGDDHDGLVKGWTGKGLVYVNPPYGRVMPKWIEKAYSEANLGAEIILLVPARTDTAIFHKFVVPPRSQAICFWRGRLTFIGAPASAPFPSMLVYWGSRVERFVAAFASAGAIWRSA